MEIKRNSSFGVIKKSLVIAVLQNNSHVFFYHLLANNVKTTFPNKLKFYEFFQHMLKFAYKTSKGKLHLKIETPKWENEGYLHYCFYDNVHKYSCIYIKVKESDQTLYLDMLPF